MGNMFKVNNKDTRAMPLIPGGCHWCCSGVFIANSEHIFQLIMFLLLTIKTPE